MKWRFPALLASLLTLAACVAPFTLVTPGAVAVGELNVEAGSGWNEADDVLRIRTRSDDLREVRLSLRRWFMAAARKELKPRLAEQAARLGLRPRAVQVRLQRTRWGSCSAQGTISLNACLMLVEPALVRYLLVHELCHLRYLDHSRRYWREVARFEPEYRSLDRQLGAAWASLPPWIFRLFRAD